MQQIQITVAICTRDRPHQLRRALSSLVNQECPSDEILVVDNTPSSEATLMIAREFPRVRYAREARPGLNVARNRAIEEASHEYVAFIDDDAVATPDWVSAIRCAFLDHPEISACSGLIKALCLETDAQRLAEANGGLSRGSLPVHLPGDAGEKLHGWHVPLIAWATTIGVGCNLCIRRSAAQELGGFDEALDRGAPLPGGGDIDIVWRILVNGGEVLYTPTAVVSHEHRRDMGAAVDQIVGHQRALIAFLTKALREAKGSNRLSILAYLMWRLLKPGWRIVKRTFGQDVLPAPVLARLWWNCWIGLVAYKPGVQK